MEEDEVDWDAESQESAEGVGQSHDLSGLKVLVLDMSGKDGQHYSCCHQHGVEENEEENPHSIILFVLLAGVDNGGPNFKVHCPVVGVFELLQFGSPENVHIAHKWVHGSPNHCDYQTHDDRGDCQADECSVRHELPRVIIMHEYSVQPPSPCAHRAIDEHRTYGRNAVQNVPQIAVHLWSNAVHPGSRDYVDDGTDDQQVATCKS